MFFKKKKIVTNNSGLSLNWKNDFYFRISDLDSRDLNAQRRFYFFFTCLTLSNLNIVHITQYINCIIKTNNTDYERKRKTSLTVIRISKKKKMLRVKYRRQAEIHHLLWYRVKIAFLLTEKVFSDKEHPP